MVQSVELKPNQTKPNPKPKQTKNHKTNKKIDFTVPRAVGEINNVSASEKRGKMEKSCTTRS